MRRMAFDPKRFVDVGRSLCPPSPCNEGASRTVHGRAYYAAFLVARERLKIAGHTNPRGNEAPHEWLIQKLRTAINDNAVRTLGDRLLALKRARVDADYELASTRSFGSGTATYAVIQASDWIRDFEAIPVPRLQKVLRAG